MFVCLLACLFVRLFVCLEQLQEESECISVQLVY